MSLSNPNKFVTEERLAEFYTQILPYLGGMPETIVNKFSKSDLYSTTEKVIGCWTDGRPLYKKTFEVTLPNAVTEGASVSIYVQMGASIKDYIDWNVIITGEGVYGKFVQPRNSTSKTVVAVSGGTLEGGITIWARNNSATGGNANTIQIANSNKGLNNTSGYLTVYYTKTTDAANSFKWGDENDYSTDEKIVGTWIDGSYVYQKTFNIGALPNGGTKHVAHNIGNFGTLIKIFGTMKGSNQASLPFVMGGSASAITLNDLNYQVMVAVDTTNIDIAVNQNLSSFNGYITLQYTKTT